MHLAHEVISTITTTTASDSGARRAACLSVVPRLNRYRAFLAGLGLRLLLLVLPCSLAMAGNQNYEPMSASVRAALSEAISDRVSPISPLTSAAEANSWLEDMSPRLEKRMPDRAVRLDFLQTVHYEASRAGLDPQLVLGLIQVESGFKKYAVSRAGARGFMQVMPFWVKTIGSSEHNLFHLRANLRYGCTILRHYLDIERGNLFRALGRYNGSLGKPEYPRLVDGALRKAWLYNPKTLPSPQPELAAIPASPLFKPQLSAAR